MQWRIGSVANYHHMPRNMFITFVFHSDREPRAFIVRAHGDPSKISQFVLKVAKILKRSENCLSIGLYCSIYDP